MTNRFFSIFVATFALLTAITPASAATITDLVDFAASNFSCCAFGGSPSSPTPSFKTLTGSFTVAFNPFETATNSTTITLDSLNVSGGSLSYYDYTPAGFYPSSVRGGLPEVFSDGSLTAYGQIGAAELILSIADINTTPLLNVAYINGAIGTNTWISTNGPVTVAGIFPDPPSPTPLPAALPLFGSSLLILAGFAAAKSRRDNSQKRRGCTYSTGKTAAVLMALLLSAVLVTTSALAQNYYNNDPYGSNAAESAQVERENMEQQMQDQQNQQYQMQQQLDQQREEMERQRQEMQEQQQQNSWRPLGGTDIR